jgi:hypothetical protein
MSSVRIIVAAAMLAASLSAAAHQQPEVAAEPEPASEAEQRAEMRREVDEAVRAIEAYSTTRRDEAVQRARAATDRMDQRIGRYHAEWLAEAEAVKARRQVERDRSMARVTERRAALEEHYRELQKANAQAWERARNRFVHAYRALADALGAAPDEHEAEDEEKKDSSREED